MPVSRPTDDFRGPPLSAADARLIAETIPHIVWIAEPDGANRYLNRQGRAYTGTRSDEIGASRWGVFVHPDDVDRARRAWVYAAETETPFRLDYRIRKFDGTYRWHAFSGLPSRDKASGVVSWIGTATDIDDAKRSEAELLSAQRDTAEALTLLKTVVSTAPFGFAFVDRDFRYVHINETLAAINGSTVGRRQDVKLKGLMSLEKLNFHQDHSLEQKNRKEDLMKVKNRLDLFFISQLLMFLIIFTLSVFKFN